MSMILQFLIIFLEVLQSWEFLVSLLFVIVLGGLLFFLSFYDYYNDHRKPDQELTITREIDEES